MLILMLACAPDSGAPLDTGPIIAFPTWSGTQIGEEGDEDCQLEGSDWDDEQSAPPGSDLTPAEVRDELGGALTGVLVSDWQGEADLIATLTLDGAAQALTDSFSGCPPALGLSGTLSLSAGELLGLQAPIDLTVQGSLGSLGFSLSDEALSGELSPGILPEDAGELSLMVFGSISDGAWSGLMEWHLQRPAGPESAAAATWSAE